MNKAILIGNLGSDPELRYTNNGTAVAELRIATGRKYTKSDGTAVDETEWHRVIAWGKQGEICKEYLTKGRKVAIEGRIQTRQWEDKEGNKRYTTEIVANQVEFLGGNGGNNGGNQQEPPTAEETFGNDDEIPF
jgi:single-strand DNA-binding protein